MSRGATTPPWSIEVLQGWHLPLLDDSAFLSLQPMLQRSLLMAVPELLITAVSHRQPLAPQVLIALQREPGAASRVLGLVISRRLNRRGSCWQLEQLRLAGCCSDDPSAPSRRDVAIALVREAIRRGRGAASWITTVPSQDVERLAILRELGFQPQRTDRLWRWRPCPAAPLKRGSSQDAVGPDLELRRLDRSSAPLLWHLEQAVCPAPLRQLLDRRIDDLLDHSHGRGWMWVDPARNEAVVGVRWQLDHPSEGPLVEFSVHPGWTRLLGPASERLLCCLAEEGPAAGDLWLSSELGDQPRQRWLEQLDAEPCGEQVLMARSVWSRSDGRPVRRVSSRLSAVLERLQPRRRPVPTPLTRQRPGPQPLPQR